MFKSWKNKDGVVEFVSTNPIVIPRNNCIHCEKPLKLGEFAYHNKICWGCFKTKMISIAKDARSLEDTEMVLDLLNIVELKTRT